jgi:hypothetical protein
MSQLRAAGLDETVADRALDRAVTGAPDPVRAGRARVTWSRRSGFTVMTLAAAAVTPPVLHGQLPHARGRPAAGPALDTRVLDLIAQHLAGPWSPDTLQEIDILVRYTGRNPDITAAEPEI